MTFKNKSFLVDNVVKKTGLTKKDSASAVGATFDTIAAVLAKKQGLRLIGFGSFSVRHRKARKGRNPQTGKPLEIAARDVPAFKPGKGLKKAVNR